MQKEESTTSGSTTELSSATKFEVIQNDIKNTFPNKLYY